MMKGMVFAERYQLADFIGQGGMSLVYRAVDIRTGHSVAIKILKSEYNSDKEFLERFQREAQAASLMSHHNIVNLLDVGVEEEYRYLVLEYVNGSTLKDVIRQKGQLSTNTSIQIAIRILSALQHAHDNGIIHRDIKPQNVLMHSDGHVKVADFGIARMTNAFTISKGDTVVGSVHYSSPEQASGTVVDATSDIYSTGVVLYEMLTGRVPFNGDTPVAVAMQHIQDKPVPISEYNPDVPPAVEAVVMKALEKTPSKRYQNAREMADALARARDGKEDPSTPPLGQPAQGHAGPQGNSRPAQQQRQRPPENRPRTPSGNTGRRAKAKRRGKRAASFVLTFVMVASVLALLTLGVIRIYTQVVSSAVAPEVEGLPLEEAQSALRRVGLNWQQRDVNHDTLPAGTVVSQIPAADTSMMKGDSVVITVSLGPVTAVMPDLAGMLRDDAGGRLKEKGLGMVVFKTASSEPVGTVLSQNPAKDTPVALGTEVEVTVSGGSTAVPDVSDMPYQDAVELLGENDLWVGRIEYVAGDSAEQAGRVASQSPTAGTLAIINAQVTLHIVKDENLYYAELNVTPPEATEEKALRAVLVKDGIEIEAFVGNAPAVNTPITQVISLTSETEGRALCRVYIGEQVLLELEVQFQ